MEFAEKMPPDHLRMTDYAAPASTKAEAKTP